MPPRRLTRLVAAGAMAATPILGLAYSNEPERSVANYCSQVQALTTLDADLASGDPIRIQARASDLRLLQQVAPTDIEPSVVILLGVTDDFARTAGTATDRSEVADEVFRGRSGDIAAIEAAGNQVAAYTVTNCQLDLDGGATTAVPGSADPSTPTTGGTDSSSTTSPGGGPTSTTTSTPSLLVD
jgi:hypothetical protein